MLVTVTRKPAPSASGEDVVIDKEKYAMHFSSVLALIVQNECLFTHVARDEPLEFVALASNLLL